HTFYAIPREVDRAGRSPRFEKERGVLEPLNRATVEQPRLRVVWQGHTTASPGYILVLRLLPGTGPASDATRPRGSRRTDGGAGDKGTSRVGAASGRRLNGARRGGRCRLP